MPTDILDYPIENGYDGADDHDKSSCAILISFKLDVLETNLLLRKILKHRFYVSSTLVRQATEIMQRENAFGVNYVNSLKNLTVQFVIAEYQLYNNMIGIKEFVQALKSIASIYSPVECRSLINTYLLEVGSDLAKDYEISTEPTTLDAINSLWQKAPTIWKQEAVESGDLSSVLLRVVNCKVQA